MPKFTKRHYIAIAEVINTTASTGQGSLFSSDALLHLALRLADTFALDNPRFDRERFLAACRVSAPDVSAPRVTGPDPRD